MDHFYDMTKGIISIRDLVYFASVIAIGLLITDQAIRSKRA
jgi:hypothetical protein